MSAQPFDVQPIAGALGAEIHGIDLREALAPETVAAIEGAWLEHEVIFFRDQPLTLEQHKAFARNFGELHIHSVLHPLKDEGHPEVVVLKSNAKVPFVADRWHSDVTFEETPPKGSVLRAVTVPDHGGDTLWASMTTAYQALSDKMQRLLSELHAVHDGGGFAAIADDASKEELKKKQTAKHPVIRTHPQTGEKTIFVNATFTKKIEGMKRAESDALLGFLYRHIETPDFQCRFRWQNDSIAMWDNRATQHKVLSDNLAAERHMQRITLIGDKPV